MNKRRLVIFDIDGTVVDSQQQIVAAMTWAFESVGLAVPGRQKMLSSVGLSLREAMLHVVPGSSDDEISCLVKAYVQSFVEIRSRKSKDEEAPLFPGARSVINDLSDSAEVSLGVATGKARRGLDHIISLHDLGGIFQTMQTADGHPSKPHPSMVLQALHETGCDARHSVIVGDTGFDMKMGRAAGVRTIGVSWGYHSRDMLQHSGAEIIIDSFDQLHGALEHLKGHPNERN